MLRDLLSSRWLQFGLVFFVLVIGGSLLYSWYTLRTTESDMERHDQLAQGIKQNETRPEGTVSVPTENETSSLVDTPDETTDTQMPEATEALSNETDDLVSEEEAPAEDVPVSPFGFGLYPEKPTGFPFNVKWEEFRTAFQELTYRVMIKAWNEGDRFVGASADPKSGKVYLNYKTTVYVRTEEIPVQGPDGQTIIQRKRRMKGAGDVPLPAIDDDFPSDVRVLDYDASGIDPYTYLDLP